MANSTSHIDTVGAHQFNRELTVNSFMDAASPATLYGRRESTSSGLIWGYYGGVVRAVGVHTMIANGTLTLTGSTTCYIEADPSDGSVSFNTSAFTAGSIQLYTVVTGSATVTSYTDHRAFAVSPNLLDDYEEGTWTPVLSDGTNNATTSASGGTYTKIGRLVHVKGRIAISSLGSVSGNVQINGLPYVSSSTSNSHSSGSVSYGVGLAITAGTSILAHIQPNQNVIKLFNWDAATGHSLLQATEFSADGDIIFDATYYV